jgi:hypothetical protein
MVLMEGFNSKKAAAAGARPRQTRQPCLVSGEYLVGQRRQWWETLEGSRI